MKLSVVVGLMLCSVLLFAQGVRTQEAPKVHSMTGCLKAGPTPGSYMLTDLEKGPKSVGIVSSDANLAPHVGHKVEITGTAVPEAEAMKMNKDVPKSPHYMKVTAMKHILRYLPINSLDYFDTAVAFFSLSHRLTSAGGMRWVCSCSTRRCFYRVGEPAREGRLQTEKTMKWLTLVFLLIVLSVASPQREHAATASQCEARQRLLLSEAEDQKAIDSVTFRTLRAWIVEIDACAEADPRNETHYYDTDAQITGWQYVRLSAFMYRHGLWEQFYEGDEEGRK